MKKYTLAYLLSSVAFNNPAWKLDENGNIVMKEGNPVFINSNGEEMVVAHDTISKRNAEAKAHRERAEAAEAKLKAFTDLDPEAARKAIETVAKIDAKKLIDSGEVDKVREQIKTEFTKTLGEKDGTIKTLQERLDNAEIDRVFAGSDFLRDNIAVPRDMFESTFRKNFKIEDGKAVAYGKDGNRLLSKEKQGEYATPEEALKILVDQHPQKDTILKANVGAGTGSTGAGGGKGTGRNIKRTDYDNYSAAEKAAVALKVGKGEMSIID